ncbi:MAG TPA: hybrid sensor histidine kinase/response regulator [Ohtaekwangia sp.]|nr:hybrid sensor histidine kinase/response regulator [Ohtaekwangia sp.]
MEKDLRILVLEDMEEDLEIVEYTLEKAGMRFQTKRVDTKEEFIAALYNYNADVILSDHFLPTFNSLEALAITRQSGFHTPFILVTGAISEEFAVNTLKQGADDYILKSNLTRLPSAIINAMKQREAEDEKAKANEALRMQYEEMLKINKELDSFVYSVSHNLRSPLMSVLGLVNLAKTEDQNRDSFFNQYFKMMETSINKLDETLKEILDYSRNARKELSIEQVDIKKIISDNLERMQYMPGSQHIRKDVVVEQEAPLFTDKFRLSFIINNLISNAIKYHDPEKDDPFLRIFIAVGKDKATMEFEDNGIGIDPRHLAKVFDMFFRATNKNDGAGLGLYIVKEAVEKLNGRIEVESELERGTRFTLEIPNNDDPQSKGVGEADGELHRMERSMSTHH